MARVKGPNGLVLTIPDGIAADLVRSPSGDYSYVEAKDEPKKAPAKKAAPKPSDKK